MNDISKCNGINCELKEKCLRFTIKGEEYQWYMDPEKRGKECEYFIKNETK